MANLKKDIRNWFSVTNKKTVTNTDNCVNNLCSTSCDENNNNEQISLNDKEKSSSFNFDQMNMKAIQPVIAFPITKFGKQNRSFQANWYIN